MPFDPTDPPPPPDTTRCDPPFASEGSYTIVKSITEAGRLAFNTGGLAAGTIQKVDAWVQIRDKAVPLYRWELSDGQVAARESRAAILAKETPAPGAPNHIDYVLCVNLSVRPVQMVPYNWSQDGATCGADSIAGLYGPCNPAQYNIL